MDKERAGFAYVSEGPGFWVWQLGGAAGRLLPKLPSAGAQLGRETEREMDVNREKLASHKLSEVK